MNKESLSQFLDYLPLGLLFFDNEGHLIWLNQKAYRVLQLTKSVKLSDLLSDGVYGQVQAMVDCMIHSESDIIISEANPIDTPYGRFDVTISPMYIPHEAASLWVCSLQKATKESLRNQTRHFDEFIHGISAPVSNLTSWLKALLEGNDQQKHFLLEPERLKMLFHRAETAVQMLNNYLFNESLVIDKDDRQSHVIDLHMMLHELLESFEWKAREKSLLVEEDFCREKLYIEANTLYIESLFTILIDNAIKYNQVNGRVVLQTMYNEDFIEVHVKDTGIGIDEKEVSFIFNDFFRSDTVYKQQLPGSGLGLSIAQKIVQMYDAEISVKSQAGKGSEFIVAFPRI